MRCVGLVVYEVGVCCNIMFSCDCCRRFFSCFVVLHLEVGLICRVFAWLPEPPEWWPGGLDHLFCFAWMFPRCCLDLLHENMLFLAFSP